jgi:Holliday junction resolvasome RuvABC endonuclease subunit
MDKAKTLVGIDGASNKTGIAVVRDGNLVRYMLLDYSRYKDNDRRITEMVNGIVEVLEKYQPDVIYYEDTWVAQNPKSSLILTTILGGIRYWAVSHSCKFSTILPTVWRKYLGMNSYRAKR